MEQRDRSFLDQDERWASLIGTRCEKSVRLVLDSTPRGKRRLRYVRVDVDLPRDCDCGRDLSCVKSDEVTGQD